MRKNVIRDRNNPLNIEVQSIQKALEQVEFLREDQLGLLEGINNELSSLELKYQESEQEVHRLNEEIAICNIELAKHDLLFATEYKARQKRFKEIVESPLTPEAREIARVIQRHEFKGIVVYPHAVHWEPLQRPQHLLMEFARKGYLCFFCDYSESFYINEIEERMFVVSNQDHLLQVLQTYHVLVINSYLLQNAWIEELPHKTIWYDVLDRVDFFSLYDRNMLAKHYQVLHDADIVTYSAVKLNEYVKDRDDAIYLPNAVRPGDFIVTEDVKLAIPDDLKPILKRKKRIIGYFGAIEEWFDTELVRKMARDPQVIIVLIGHCGISKENFPKNVYFLGMKPYSQLKNYAVHFDALMIPFIVNSLTNAVSPVKFFEYCSLGKPIITTPIAEVLSYQGPGITYVDTEHFDGFHRKLWDLSNEAKAHLQKLSDDNQWGKRALQIESELESRQSCLKLFANRSFSNHVSVFAATFLDYEGENYYSGGAERYLVDLHEVCNELGLKLDIYQYGNFPWYRKFNDIDVYSLGHESLDIKVFSYECLNKFNRRFLHAVEETSILNFYSAFFQAYPNVAHPSIGISHGVAWDNPSSEFTEGNQFWNYNERFITSAKQVQRMVSVDTNTANWFQTVSHDLGQKMLTIPNYVDPEEFFPVSKNDDGKIKIVYPRRLYEARGLYITLAIVDNILEKYPDAEFHFVGKGFDDDIKEIEKVQSRWPDRVFCYYRNMEDMHLVYKNADIVLIPTLYSEGTSLSCLEACATGNTIISTRIGGLTDIIIDHFNGILISPDSKSLEKAIIECLENPQLRKRLGENAIEVSKAFNKKIWKEHWKEVIKDLLSEEVQKKLSSESQLSDQTIEIRLGANAEKHEWMPIVVGYLNRGGKVFIRGDRETWPESSFARIQWISEKAELYFQPDIIKRFD